MIQKYNELEEPPYVEAHVYVLVAFFVFFFKKPANTSLISLKLMFQVLVVPNKLSHGKVGHKIPDNYYFTAQMC